MGNSDSTSISSNASDQQDPLIEQFNRLKVKEEDFITEETFKRALERSRCVSERLWILYVTNDVPGMTFTAYSSLIHALDDRGDKLNKLAEILLTKSDDKCFSEDAGLKFLRLFFEVPLDNHEGDPTFVFNAFKATVHSSDETAVYEQTEFVNWLNKNFPDIAEDLFHYVYTSLSSRDRKCPDLNAIKSSSTQCILTPEIAVYLSFLLPPVYKYGFSIETSDVLSYEVEKIGNWNLLFTTARDGASVSRFIDSACEYMGPAIILLKTDVTTYCIASDSGLKESYQSYGNSESRLFQLYPTFSKLVSGSTRGSTNSSQNGIIYCHFTTQSGRRGISVGHQPLQRPVLEIDGDLSQVSLLGQQMKLYRIEVWAAGDPRHMRDFITQKKWNKAQIEKNKNRKFKLDDWADSPDRQLLSWGGVNVTHSEVVEDKREQ